MDIRLDFEDMIADGLARIGGNLEETGEALADYAAERSERLAEILDRGEPGFEDAVIAARDNLALKAGLKAGEDVDAAAGEWLGLFAGALRFAAVALAQAGKQG